MSHDSLPPDDISLLTKEDVCEALAFYEISHGQLARNLGIEKSRVDACLAKSKVSNLTPFWWFNHRRFPRQVRRHVFEKILLRMEQDEMPSQASPEELTVVALTRVGQFVTVASATLGPPQISRMRVEVAAQLLRVVDIGYDAFGALRKRLMQRIETGRHPAAKAVS